MTGSLKFIGKSLTVAQIRHHQALMTAREHCFPDSRLYGLPVAPAQVCVLVPDIIEHYSIRSAMAWLNMGEKHIIRVPVDTEIKNQLIQNGDIYIHGFMLKSCPHVLLPNAMLIYVLRTLSGNPLTTFPHIRSLLDEVVRIGWKIFR